MTRSRRKQNSSASRVKIAGAYGSCFCTTTMAVWNTCLFKSDAIVNSPSTTAIEMSEAARSLGAGWLTVFFRVLVPNIRRGMLAASVIATAVVLGEFTIASLLNRENLQTSVLLISRSDPYVATIFALLALLFAFVLLVIIGRVGAVQPRRSTP